MPRVHSIVNASLAVEKKGFGRASSHLIQWKSLNFIPSSLPVSSKRVRGNLSAEKLLIKVTNQEHTLTKIFEP